jgi:hypothetical protein
MNITNYPNTLLPQYKEGQSLKDYSKEVNKGFINLLDKVNAVGSKSSSSFLNVSTSQSISTITNTLYITTGKSALTFTLPTGSPADEQIITLLKVDTGSGTATINTNAADTMQLSPNNTFGTSFVLKNKGDCIVLQYNFASKTWWLVNKGYAVYAP